MGSTLAALGIPLLTLTMLDKAEPKVVRRLGYYIARPDDTYDFKVMSKPASEEVLAELKAITDVVFLLQPIVIALSAVQQNRNELENFVTHHPHRLASSQSGSIVDAVVILEAMVEASRLANNFLCATTGLLSLMQTSLTLAWGKNSAQFTTWNLERRTRHAASFAYRILYELRNFAQHRSLPISSINVIGNRLTNDSSMTYATHLRLKRDALLVEGFDWGKLRAELARQPDEFDLMPLVVEYSAILEALVLDVFMVERVRLTDCVRYMDAIKRVLDLPDGGVPMLCAGDAALMGPPASGEIVPLQQLRWVTRYCDGLMNRIHPPESVPAAGKM